MKNVYGGEKRGITIQRLMIMFYLLTHVIMRTYTYITITVDGTLLLRQFGSEVLGEPGSPAYAYSLQLYGSDVCSLTTVRGCSQNIEDIERSIDHLYQACFAAGPECALQRDTEKPRHDSECRVDALIERLDTDAVPRPTEGGLEVVISGANVSSSCRLSSCRWTFSRASPRRLRRPYTLLARRQGGRANLENLMFDL